MATAFYPLTLALLRLFTAFMFWQHGAQKLFGLFGAKQAETFSILWFAGGAEFLGAFALAIGFLTRPFAFILALDMAVVYLTRYLPQGFPPILNRDGETACLLFLICSLLVFTGPERFSVEGTFKPKPGVNPEASLRQYYPAALTIFRIFVGLLFVQHGLQKVFGMLSGAEEEFLALRWFAGVIELIGGPAIVLGLFTRPVAFILCGEMAFAYFINHNPRSFWPIINLGERTVLFCYTYLFLVTAGPGKWSLDGLLRKKAGHNRELAAVER